MDKFLLLLLVTFAGVAGIFLLKIILKRVFSIQMTSILSFTLWLVLTIVLGSILYMCFTEGFSSFSESDNFRHSRGGSLGAFIVLLLFWFIMLLSSFKKIKPERKKRVSIPKNAQNQIDDSNQNQIGKN